MTTISWNSAVSGDYTVGSNWSPDREPGSSDDALIAIAGSYTVSLAAAAAVNSLTVSDGDAAFAFTANGSLSIATSLDSAGVLYVDANGYGEGGSTITVGGTLTNSNQLSIGNSGLSANATVTAAVLAGTGGITLQGNGNNLASLIVASAAPGTLSSSLTLIGDALLQYGSEQIGTIASGGYLQLNGAAASIADAGAGEDSALASLSVVSGRLDVENGQTLAVAGPLDDTGQIYVDDTGYGEGGGTLAVGGTLTVSGLLGIGNSGLSSNSTVTAADLSDSGIVDLTGDGGNRAALLVAAVAPATLSGALELNNNALVQYGGGQIGTIASGGYLVLNGPSAVVADAGTLGGESALTGLNTVGGRLDLDNGATLALSGNFDDTGDVYVDDTGYGEGGSTLTVAATLTDNGVLVVGNTGLSANAVVTAAALTGSGVVELLGNGTNEAELLVAAAAPTALTGSTTVVGNALLQFGGGQIGTLASGAYLGLGGTAAFVSDAGTLGSNSALAGLSDVAGRLDINSGETIALTGSLTDSGQVQIDNSGYGQGGTTLTVAGTITDAGGQLDIGNGGLSANATVRAADFVNNGNLSLLGVGTNEASLILAAAAPTTLTGSTTAVGNALIEYVGGGQVGTIASGAYLGLGGTAAFVSDAGTLGSNSALTGLSDVAGRLDINNGETIALTGSLTDSGQVQIDNSGYGQGGTTLTVAGTITDAGGQLDIGNGGLSANATVRAADFVNNGNLSLLGVGTNEASLILAAAAPTTLTGSATVVGSSVIEYSGGGQIGTLASGAYLGLGGTAAFVSDAGTLGSNSALTGLSDVAGRLDFNNGETIALTGSLTDSGQIQVDNSGYGQGGSTLTVAGTIAVTGGQLDIGNGGLSANATVRAADFVNDGNVYLQGNGTNEASLVLTAAAPTTLTGTTTAVGNAVIEYVGGGQIGTLASGAYLGLGGTAAFVSDAGTLGSNSALAGLSAVAGHLDVNNGETVAIAGNLTDSGQIQIDNSGYGQGGTTLTVAGTLTNSSQIELGDTGQSAAALLRVGTLINSNYVQLQGSGTVAVTLDVTGSASNTGNFDAAAGGESVVDITGTYTQTAGSTEFGGQLNAGTVLVDGGVVTAAGGTLNASTLDIASSGSLVGSGVIAAGTLVDGGDLEASDGVLELTDSLSGNAITVDSGATLALDGTISNNVSLTGSFDLVDVVAPAGQFTGTLDGFGAADTLLIQNVVGTSDSYANGVLTVFTATGSVSIDIAGSFASNAFRLNPTSLDESVITLGTSSQALAVSGPASLSDTSAGQIAVSPLSFSDTAIASDTLVASAQYGLLSAAAEDGGSVAGSGSSRLTLTGSAAAVSQELATLTYNSNGATETLDTISLQATDDSGLAASTFISVVLDQPPTIDVPAAALVQDGTASLLGAVSIVHPGDEAGETYTVTLSDTAGTLAGTAEMGGSVSAAGTTLTLTGTLAAVDAELATVAFLGTAPDTVVLAVNDGRGGTAASDLGVVVNTSPIINAATIDGGFANVAIALPASVTDAYAQDAGTTLTATITDATGLLTATASGSGTVTGDGSNDLVLTGTLAALNAELSSLSFTGTASQTVSVAVNNGAGLAASATITAELSTGPTLSLPTSLYIGTGGTPELIRSGTIADIAPASTPLTVTLTALAGTLGDIATGGAAVSGSGSSELTLTGNAAQINTSLAGITYDGVILNDGTTETTGDTITVVASDPGGSVTQDISLTVGQVLYYSPALTAFGTLGTDYLANAPVSQIDTDAAGVYSNAIAGAIGSAGGVVWQQAFASSAQAAATVGADIASGASGATTLADTLALYSSLTAGLLGTVAGNASPSATANVLSAAMSLSAAIEAAASANTLQSDATALYTAIKAAVPAATNPGGFTTAAQTTSTAVATLANDLTNGAAAAQILADSSSVFDSVVSGSLGAIGGASLQQAYESGGQTVATLGATIAGGGTALQIDEQVSGTYGSVVANVASPTALVPYDDVVQSAAQFAAGVAGASSSDIVSNSVPLYNTVSFAVFGQTNGVAVEQDLQAIQNGLLTLTDTQLPTETSTDQTALDVTTFEGTVITGVLNALDGPIASTDAATALAAAATLGADGGNGASLDQYISDGFNYLAGLFSTMDAVVDGTTPAEDQAIQQAFAAISSDVVNDNTANFANDAMNLYMALFEVGDSSGQAEFGGKPTAAQIQAGTQFVNSILPILQAMPSDKSQSAVAAHLYDIANTGLNQFLTGKIGSSASTYASKTRADILNWLGDVDNHRPLSAQADLKKALVDGAVTATFIKLQTLNGGKPVELGKKATAYLESMKKDFNKIATDVEIHRGSRETAVDVKQLALDAEHLIESQAVETVAGKLSTPGLKAVAKLLPRSKQFGKAIHSHVKLSVGATVVPKKSVAVTSTGGVSLTFNDGLTDALPTESLTYKKPPPTSYTIQFPTSSSSQSSPTSGGSPTTTSGGGGGGGSGGGGAVGDVHLTTFNGLYYNFQAVGEFVLARSTTDSFQVQIRLQPWNNSAAVSVITEVAVGVGSNRVTFDVSRNNTVWENGAPVATTPGGAAVDLGQGVLMQLTATSWEILYDSGEMVTVTNEGSFLDVTFALPSNAPAGTYQGLLGNDSNDPTTTLVLPNGTALPEPLTSTEIYTTLANAYRVTQASSLLDYGTGQTTATFTDVNFPSDTAPLASLPPAVVAMAAQVVAAAGITDPAAVASAELDYALTGDTQFVTSAAAAAGTTPAVVILPDPAPATPPPPAAGISAVAPTVLENAGGTTELDFTVYATATSSIAETLNYAVVQAGSAYLGASSFAGGMLPSGTIVIPAGQTAVPLAIDVFGTIGDVPSAALEVVLSAPSGGLPVAGSTAIVQIDNDQVVPGIQAVPIFVDASNTGTLTQSGTVFTLSIGNVLQGSAAQEIVVDLSNAAASGGNTLSGNYVGTAAGGLAFTNGLPPVVELTPGQVDQIAAILSTGTLGAVSATVTFDANASNVSGYQAALTPITLDISGTIVDQPPTLSVPADEVFLSGVASPLTGLAITNTGSIEAAKTFSVTVSDTAGLLGATAVAGGTVAGSGSTAVTVTGTLAAVDAELADLTFTGTGADTLSVGVNDGAGGTASASVPVTLDTAPAISAPASATDFLGEAGAIGAIGVADPTLAANLLTVILTDTAGLLGATASGAATVSGAGSTTLTVAGTLAAVNATLATLTDVGSASPSPDPIAITAKDPLGLSATATVAVTAVAPPPPTLTLPTSLILPVAATGAAPGISVTDPGVAGAGGTLTIGITDAKSLLAPLTLTGTVAALDTELAGLSVGGPAAAQTDALTITATDPASQVASGTIPVLFDTPPALSVAAANVVLPLGGAPALSGIGVTDPGIVAAGTTLSLALSDTVGLLSVTAQGGVTVSGNGTTGLTLAGSVAGLSATLATLTDAGPTTPTLDHLSVVATDPFGQTGTTSISVEFDTAPTLSAPSSLAATAGQVTPVSGVSVRDPGVSGSGGTLSIGIDDMFGLFSAAAAPGATIGGIGTTALTVTGSVAAVDAVLASLGVSFAGGGFTDTISITATDPFGLASVASVPANVACFAHGTHVETPRGEIRVEALRPGDEVCLAAGGTRRVAWVGTRHVVTAHHDRPELVQPVRIRAGAFGAGLPHRDLLLSPDHAVFRDGVLIPVKYLVDGAGIVQESVAEVRYFHVELDAHDVLLAEGLPAESYLDTGDRAKFANADIAALAAGEPPPMAACAPLCLSGPVLDSVRRTLRQVARGERPATGEEASDLRL